MGHGAAQEETGRQPLRETPEGSKVIRTGSDRRGALHLPCPQAGL